MQYSELTVDGADTWNTISDNFVPMDHRYRDPLSVRVRLTVQETAAYTLLQTEQYADQLVSRTSSHVRRGPDSFYWMVLPHQGAFTFQEDDTATPIPPRRALLMRLDQTWQLRMPRSVAYAFRIPREEVDRRLSSAGPPRTVLNMESGLGRVVRSMITETHAEQATLSAREFDAICDRIGELLCMMSMGDMSPQQAHLAETAAAVRRFVRENVGVGDIRLPAVAHMLGWSPRQLQFALQQTGTTYREIRQDAALHAARDMLSQPGPQALSIGEVAARCGFTNTWFSTAFKARYGETPRDFQKRRLTEMAGQPTMVTTRQIAAGPET